MLNIISVVTTAHFHTNQNRFNLSNRGIQREIQHARIINHGAIDKEVIYLQMQPIIYQFKWAEDCSTNFSFNKTLHSGTTLLERLNSSSVNHFSISLKDMLFQELTYLHSSSQ